MLSIFNAYDSWQEIADEYAMQMSYALEVIADSHKAHDKGSDGVKEFMENCRALMLPNALKDDNPGPELRAARILARMAAPYRADCAKQVLQSTAYVLAKTDEAFYNYNKEYPESSAARSAVTVLEFTLMNLEEKGVARSSLAAVVNVTNIRSPHKPSAGALSYVGAMIDPTRRLRWPEKCFPEHKLFRSLDQ